jgi:hypothetical protein
VSARRALSTLFVALAAALLASAPTGAAAQDESCGSGGGLTGVVTIDSPAPNASVAGTVQVTGTASARPVGTLTRVEATLGGASDAGTYPAAATIEFSLTLDVSNVAPGRNTLTVTACGTSSLTGALSRGSASVPVVVKDASAATTTTVGQTTTTAATRSSGSSGSSAAGATTTTTSATADAAGAVVGRGAATSTTATSSPSTTTTAVAAPAPVAPAAKSDQPKARSGSNRPVVLTETPAKHGSGKPLWVGAVVGVSGVIGVMFSAATWRRRTHVPEYAEPIDADLVDVR